MVTYNRLCVSITNENKSNLESLVDSTTINKSAIVNLALKKFFGETVENTPISSIKSIIGHTMGAAAAIEAVASVLVLNNNKLPVNMNLNKLDPAINLNVVSKPTEKDAKCILSNAFAFGGNISCIVLKQEA